MLTNYQSMYWVVFNMFSHITVWLTIIIVLFAALMPDIILKTIKNMSDMYKVNKAQLIASPIVHFKNSVEIRM